ncbi:MAG: hypothetical protein MHMPM18_004051 [Marteilia pararefringens]
MNVTSPSSQSDDSSTDSLSYSDGENTQIDSSDSVSSQSDEENLEDNDVVETSLEEIDRGAVRSKDWQIGDTVCLEGFEDN